MRPPFDPFRLLIALAGWMNQQHQRGAISKVATSVAESKRLWGTLCQDDQRVLSGSVILFGEGSLRRAVQEFIEHYHRERNQQGRINRLITPQNPTSESSGPIRCRQRLGGMLNNYYRQAA